MSLVAVDSLTRVEVLDLLGKLGRCHNYPTGWWYPTGPGGPGQMPGLDYAQIKRDERKAKKICGSCPMRKLCLSYALSYHETHGIWGGYSERQRNVMRKQRTALYVEATITRVSVARSHSSPA